MPEPKELQSLLLLWEALRGQSLVALDRIALASLVIWAVVTTLVFGWIGGGSRPQGVRNRTGG